MAIIKTEQLVYEYTRYDDEGNASGTSRALNGVSLELQEGSFVAILGHNGSGKSTFAKHMNALFLPTEGTVWVDGMQTTDEGLLFEIRRRAGMVFQNPDNQIVGNIVEEDVGFGPENIGIETKEIWNRVDDAISRTGLSAYRTVSPHHLSGGQKQRVAIAGVLAMKPKCIILDEPTAMLDPNGRREVLRTLHELNRKEGITIILITHYMEEVVDADRVVVMNHGEVIMDGTPGEIFRHPEQLKNCGLAVPQVTSLAFRLKAEGIQMPEAVLTPEEFLEALRKVEETKYPSKTKGNYDSETKYDTEISNGSDSEGQDKLSSRDESVLMELKNLSCTYLAGTVQAARAVEDVSLVIHKGEFIGLAGHTGSGKSSLIQHLNGLIKPTEGVVLYRGQDIWNKKSRRKGLFSKKKETEVFDRLTMKFLRQRVGLVFQYPENQLFEETVLKDVEFGPKNLGMKEELAREAAVEALRQVGLDEKYYQVSPFDLSGGQKRRVAIAGVLAMNPEILILDEPTAGLDPMGRDELLSTLAELRKERNLTIILVSHSMEDLAEHAERIIVMNHGKKVMDAAPREIFARQEELEKMSLGVPQVTRIMNSLRQEGLIQDPEICITVEEAAKQILSQLNGN